MFLKKDSDSMRKDWYAYENNARIKGYRIICGVDEVGRGPLAGPVFAAAVVLPERFPDDLRGINDSKKMTPKKREEFYEKIISIALDYAITSVSEKLIDKKNILQATLLCMTNAIGKLHTVPDFVLIDGNKVPNIKIPAIPIVRGDNLSASIAAASIIAKVSRDRYMLKMAELYPKYDFQNNKGYGTINHVVALKKYGPCSLHRFAFLKKILG